MAYLEWKMEIDWDDNGLYAHEHSDISSYIESLSLGFGMGALNNPEDFSISAMFGTMNLHKGLPVSAEDGLYLRHAFRLSLDGRVYCLGYVHHEKPRQYRLESRNYELLNRGIVLPIDQPLTDAQIFQRILSAAGIRQKTENYFNHYGFAELVIMEGKVRDILADFAKLAGGYVLEHFDSSMSFVAPRSRQGAAGDTIIHPLQTTVFESEVVQKPHAIRNQVRTAVPIVATVTGQDIASFNIDVEANGESVVDVKAANNTLVRSWAVESDNTTLTPSVANSDSLTARILVNNSQSSKQTGKVSVTGDVKSIAATTPVETERLGSIHIWGVVPFRDLKEWMGDATSFEQELSRRDAPLRVANLEMPFIAEIRDWIFLDPGSLILLNNGDETINMMMARKYINISRDPTFRVHLVEFPLNYPEEYWVLDDPTFMLEINTYLGDGNVPVRLEIFGDHLLYFTDDLTYQGDTLTYF